MYLIILIILLLISYYILNIYEQFQAGKKIKNICYYDKISNLYYPEIKDKGIKIFVNDYLNYCNGVGTLKATTLDWFKASKINTYLGGGGG
jgi:hypothetical protein